MVESDTPEGTTLVPNPNYWGEKPNLDRSSWWSCPMRAAACRRCGGDIDATGGSLIAAVSPQDARTLKASGANVVTDTGTDTMILGFNPKRRCSRMRGFGRRFNLLIDRKGIANALLQGYATPTMNLYPEVIAYSGKRYDVPSANVERAKKLLDEAGWTGDAARA